MRDDSAPLPPMKPGQVGLAKDDTDWAARWRQILRFFFVVFVAQ